MKQEFVTVNGKEYGERIAREHYGNDVKITVQETRIPGWGGGYTERGWRVTVESQSKNSKN